MDPERTRCLTIRAVFKAAAVQQLQQEGEFEGQPELINRDGNRLFADAYFAVFVLQAEATDEGMLKIRPVSTTVLGIQKYTVRKLMYQGVFEADPTHGLLAELLRAHFRAEIFRRGVITTTLYSQNLARWSWHFLNGAGDLANPTEMLIRDPELEQLNRLYGDEGPAAQDDGPQDG